jgi:hypothetical protein
MARTPWRGRLRRRLRGRLRGRLRVRAAAALLLVLTLPACGEGGTGDGRGGADGGDGRGAGVGGHACDGWVTTDAVETAIGRDLDDLEVRVIGGRDGLVLCQVRDGDTSLLTLESRRWGPEAAHELELAEEHAEARPGPLDPSVLWPGPGRHDGILGIARVERPDGQDRELDVRLLEPPAEGDGYDAVARLVTELARSVAEGPAAAV